MDEWILPIFLGLMAGGGVFLIVRGLAGPPRRLRVQRETLLPGIQVRLDKADLGISAGAYLARSLGYGVAFGLIMTLATGSWLVFFAGLVGGFAFVWSRLEDRRNERVNAYNKAVAAAADTIVNSWRSKASVGRALEQVAAYGQGEVAKDFDEILLSVRAGNPLGVALQQVADRRQSSVFDSLAVALLLAAEASGEVTDMLTRQADATRQMAIIYEETIDMQKGQRQDTMWGIVGPWGLLVLIRFGTILTGGVGYGTEFFATPLGQIAAVVAAVLTIVAYVHSHRTASRGLVVKRIGLEHGEGDSVEGAAHTPVEV
jgi:hypothetical protein